MKNYARCTALKFKNLRISPENSAEGLWSRREHCWGYISFYENALYLLVQGKAQLEDSSHIVKVGVEATS